MQTEKLYYTQPETLRFSCRVLSCAETARGWEVVTDRTAFYPEGGGQPCDLGQLGSANVLDVQEKDGAVVHLLDRPLDEGTEVSGAVDGLRRRDYTEQHTADHVLCGVIHREYGFDNVGFHMGAETTTIDLNGWLDPEELARLEAEANAVIRENLPVLERWPEQEELAGLVYRSKKELSGPVRLIEIPGVDLCACCGTHLKSTGELGLIKVVSTEKLHGSLRMEILAGERAWKRLAAVFAENQTNSALLSAKPLETSLAVARLLEERQSLKTELAEMEKRWRNAVADAFSGGALVLEDPVSPPALQRLTDALMEKNDGLCAVFSPDGEGGYRYAVGQKNGDLRELVKDMNAALSGRGGGKPGFAQGRVEADRNRIEAFFKE